MKTIIQSWTCSLALILTLGSLSAQNVKHIDTLRMNLQAIVDQASANYGMEGIEFSLIFDDQWGPETFYSGIRAPGIPVDTAKPWHFAQAVGGYLNYIALKLIEEGKMSLNDSIGAHMDVAVMGLDGSISVRQLLRHTSVLNEFWGNSAAGSCFNDIWLLNPTQLGCPQDLLSCLPANKANPGNFDRNNTNLLVLQFLIDSVSGQSYEAEIQNRIFTPMGMTKSYLSSCKAVTIDSINGIWQGTNYANNRSYLRYFSTNGGNRGLIAKSYEVVKFYRALFQGQLLGSAAMDSIKAIIPGSAQPQGSYSCASSIMGYSGYNTDIVEVIDSQGDTTWLYGKGGAGMNGHLTLHIPTKDYTISFAHNDRSSLLGQRNLAMDLFCYLNAIDTVITSSVGIVKNEIQNLAVYPNPARDFVKLDLPNLGKKYQLSLYSLSGQVIIQKEQFSSDQLSVSELPQGVYLLRLKADDAVYQARFMKTAF
tara:strand:+ start:8882 stop:10318 length:1437 start_codon:yes stop_codon:yes gene_type:complete